MMNYLTIPCLLLLLTACGTTRQPTEVPPEVAARLTEARQLLADSDADGALLITDKLLKEDPKQRDALLLAAEANVALVSAGRGAITQSFIEDAIRNYERALAIEGADPTNLNRLSDVYRMKGDYDHGAEVALEAASQLQDRDPDAFAKSLHRAAENEIMIFKIARNDELKSEDTTTQPETLAKANLVLSRIEKFKEGLPGEGYLMASEVYRWLGRGFDEIDQLERGITTAPDFFPLHERYRELRGKRGEEAQCVAFYRAYLRDEGMNVAMVYALGMAESALGDRFRRDGNMEEAGRAYSAALLSFGRCKDNRQSWAENCDHWRAIEYLSLAAINLETGNHGPAKGYLEKALAATPKVAEVDENGVPLVLDAFRSHYFGTMNRIGNSIQSGGTKESLREGLEYWEHFINLHEGLHGWMYNNAALNARDLGTAIEKAARTPEEKAQSHAEAMKLYERSYALYQVAARLDPKDARTVNDCGLMLLFHLKRDYDVAEKLFRQAIEVGEPALADLPDDLSVDDRNVAEEAVGDAYQNLGKLYMEQGKPFDQYAPLLRKAVQFYPKNRREAAIWLRRGDSPRPEVAAAKRQPGGARAAEFETALAPAKAKATTKDYDGALLLLDALRTRLDTYAPYHYLRGLYSLRYAQQAVANRGSVGQIEGLFSDARNNLQRAIELDGDPVEPRLRLAEANYVTGEYENAAKIAAALILHISSLGGTDRESLAMTQRIRAQSNAALYFQARKRGGEGSDELQAARDSFRNLQKLGQLDAETRGTWARLDQEAGQADTALARYEEAIAAGAPDQALISEFVTFAESCRRSARAAAALAPGKDGVTQWFRGMALYYAAFEAPAKDSPEGTTTALEQSIASFDLAAKTQPSFRASSESWIASCHGALGFHALAANNLTEAESQFLTAAKQVPARINAPISEGRSVKNGIQLLIDAHYKARDLPAAIATLDRACPAMKDEADLWNNLGLFSRDHGVALERAGKAEAAKAHYEKSYAAYRRAVALEPKSVRQRNDLMVMILYHLKRDLETVEPTLRSCIADGEKQLAEDPPEDEQTLRDLNEAVGDSYENLGFYQMNFAKAPDKARENLKKSLEFYPFDRRRSTALLRQLGANK